MLNCCCVSNLHFCVKENRQCHIVRLTCSEVVILLYANVRNPRHLELMVLFQLQRDRKQVGSVGQLVYISTLSAHCIVTIQHFISQAMSFVDEEAFKTNCSLGIITTCYSQVTMYVNNESLNLSGCIWCLTRSTVSQLIIKSQKKPA